MLLSLSTLLLASASVASAAPGARRQACKSKPVPVLPTNSNGTPLPSPPAGLMLKHIGLGHGYQNYTCAAAGSPAVATGALAVLYDALPLYPAQSAHSLPLAAWLSLPTPTVRNASIPLALATNTRIALSAEGASAAAPFPAAPAALDLAAFGVPAALPAIGVHYFDAAGNPNFRVGAAHMVAKKVAAQNPPANATVGPHGEKAVAWLYLADKGNSTGITAAYRVDTAAGSAHECTGAGDDSSVYAAYYFLYGPAS